VTGTVAVKMGGPPQNVSVGPLSLKAIVPVGCKPPSIAVSRIGLLTKLPGEAVVVSAAVNFETITDSLGSAQDDGGTELFMTSPL
jgi:hypothetical protein